MALLDCFEDSERNTAYYDHHRSHQALENQTPVEALERDGSI